MKKYILLFLMTTFISTLSLAQFSNDTTNNVVVRDTLSTEQATPLSVTTSAGQTYVSWFDFEDGAYQLRMQLLDIDGSKLWAPAGIVVSSYPQSTALFRYDLKLDQNDNAIVAFQDERSGSLKVVAYKIDPIGNFVWGNAGVALTDSLAEGLGPTICVTQSNDVIIAWNADYNSSKWISFQKISAAGALLWSKRIFDPTNSLKYSRAVMVPYGADDFTMLYVQEVGSFPGLISTLLAQHYDINGNGVWTTPKQVSTKTISFFFFPQIITDTHNGFYIAFNTSNPSNPSLNDVYAQHMDSLGVLWSVTGTECGNSTTTQKLTGGFCYSAVNNELYVSIQVLDAGQSTSGVYLQKLNAAGTVQLGANAIQLIALSATYYAPVGIVDAGNGLITIYYYGGFANQKIAAKKTDYSGLALWSYDPTICNYLSNKDDISSGLFANNQSVIVWDDDRLDKGVYAQNITGDGLFGVFTAVIDIDPMLSMQLYPNPSSSFQLEMELRKSESGVITVMNVEGKICYQQKILLNSGKNKIQMNGEDFPTGMYLICLMTSEGEYQKKWMKE